MEPHWQWLVLQHIDGYALDDIGFVDFIIEIHVTIDSVGLTRPLSKEGLGTCKLWQDVSLEHGLHLAFEILLSHNGVF